MKPHVVFRNDHTIAFACPTYKEAHDIWKRWKDNSERHAPIYIGVVGRVIDPSAEIVDVSE